MNQTLYIVRLRRVFYWRTLGGSIRMETAAPNIRAFATHEQAEQFATTLVPAHSPFETSYIQWKPTHRPTEPDPVDDFLPENEDAIIGQEYCRKWKEEQKLDSLDYPQHNDGYDENIVSEDEETIEMIEANLITTVRNIGFIPPIPTMNEWGTFDTTHTWRVWWNDHAVTMTDEQRAAIWHVFTSNPYRIVALPAEL